ncbi:BbrUII/HgiDII family restriction enzyme [Microbacterium arborescens]|uniref:BbrUII/HgiDII family restriction enzyme n=1 Tax=Microbacterium arborescens TaxID=33883 RepID=UPI003C70D260
MTETNEVIQGESSDPGHKYTMTVDLSVLESLGINLYSNAAAVLSELVANAYDADAGAIDITWRDRAGAGDPTPEAESDSADDADDVAEQPPAVAQAEPAELTEIVVSDDGSGMTVEQLNERFLTAGYKKRDKEGHSSPKWHRPFMGRKGIGKLSVFSLARTIEVYSRVPGGEANGLRIDVTDLEEAIRDGKAYHPESIAVPHEFDRDGTTIVLSDLKRKRTAITAAALRKRLARRFDVMDTTSPSEGGFHIKVNGTRVTWADRQELKRLQLIWEFNGPVLPDTALPRDIKRFSLPRSVVNAEKGWHVSGWFGTTGKPTDLVADEEAGSLKNIIVLARKRPIQEGIIEKLDFSRIFGNYVTGQIEADFLDLDEAGYDDIATSDRQRLIEDDERVVALQSFLREMFVVAADQWSAERPKQAAKDAVAATPKLQEWLDSLEAWQRPSAERMIGTISSLDFEKTNEKENRSTLYRSGILAFARVGLRKNAEELDKLADVTADRLLPLLGQQDAYEAALWADILRSRVEAITQFRGLTDANEKERVLQTHLFDHMWLLDPSWDRPTANTTMEENLRRFHPDVIPEDPEGTPIDGRVDIRYRAASGKHIIVELKRYGRRTTVEELAQQGTKYYTALADVLNRTDRAHEVPMIEVVFVVGSEPTTTLNGRLSLDTYREGQFAPSNGRRVLYDALIHNAQVQYEEYLDASEAVRKLDDIVKEL